VAKPRSSIAQVEGSGTAPAPPPGDVVLISRMRENVDPVSVCLMFTMTRNPSAFTWNAGKTPTEITPNLAPAIEPLALRPPMMKRPSEPGAKKLDGRIVKSWSEDA
jgi:hypothetical protein